MYRAGMLEDGSFIRIYPIDYRYRDYGQWYKKYQWIEVEVEKHTSRDNRKESYRPNVKSIRILGEPLDTKSGWKLRKEIVLKKPPQTMEQLKELQEKEISVWGWLNRKKSKILSLNRIGRMERYLEGRYPTTKIIWSRPKTIE